MISLAQAEYGCFASAFFAAVLILAALRAFVMSSPLAPYPLVEVAMFFSWGTVNALLATMLFVTVKHHPPRRQGLKKRKAH